MGSNLGDRAANLRAAIRSLKLARINVLKISSFYETEPVGYLDQPWFLNCVVEGETNRQHGDIHHENAPSLRLSRMQLGEKLR